MIGGKKVLAVIAARGGSKELPRKNVLDLGGKPLIAWTIEAGQGSACIDRLLLSSDDDEIIAIAGDWGCEAPFVRPGELAADQSKVEDALIHALDALDEAYDYLVLLQPTSPLRLAADIDGALAQCHRAGAPACVGVTTPDKPPQWMFQLDDEGRMQRLMETEAGWHRRQDLRPVYVANGAVYVARVPWFRDHRTFYSPDTQAYLMPRERSFDIDSQLDLDIVGAFLNHSRGPSS